MCQAGDGKKDKTSLKEDILKQARHRADEWGHDVAFRANSALCDLPAVEARYQKECKAMFFTNVPTSSVL